MKYDEKEFNSSVDEYKKFLRGIKGSVLAVFDISSQKAFFSLAPLSRAIHELKADMHVMGIDGNSETLDALNDVWETSENLKAKESHATKALKRFIDILEKKSSFKDLFEKPDYTFYASEKGFEGEIRLNYNDKWFKEYKSEELFETCKKIWKDVYNLKDNERVSIGSVLLHKQEMLGHPLEDYLDSQATIWQMMKSCNGIVSLAASTQRKSMLENGERIAELKATLLGCELCKEADEEVFRAYKSLSEILNLQRIRAPDASFFISGKGYHGKHLFGEVFGYPSLNKKTRWQSPGQMIYKLDFYPQTSLDDRAPLARVGFTETIPQDIFIETCNIDWNKMRERNFKIKEIADKCALIKIKGSKINNLQTDFEVGLRKSNGENRWIRTSDTDIKEKINSEYLKKTGIKAGTMANLPGGEAFTTPEYVEGTIIGDVVISIDQSYPLSEKKPIVIKANKDTYRVVSGPKKIIKKLEEKKSESWKILKNLKKHKSSPKELIELQKNNFNRIGEFAINTNPKARLCDYLIVNEKIARMVHVALGSGFEPDRSTTYHTDIVINSPRQKLNIYGIDKQGKKHWIIKQGDFIV